MIKLLYAKSSRSISFVTVKFIAFERHFQKPQLSLYFVSVYIFIYAYTTACLWRSKGNLACS